MPGKHIIYCVHSKHTTNKGHSKRDMHNICGTYSNHSHHGSHDNDKEWGPSKVYMDKFVAVPRHTAPIGGIKSEFSLDYPPCASLIKKFFHQNTKYTATLLSYLPVYGHIEPYQTLRMNDGPRTLRKGQIRDVGTSASDSIILKPSKRLTILHHTGQTTHRPSQH